jgi:putative peptidoglycan lipid II flippase
VSLNRKLASATGVLFLGTLLSRVLGFLRETMLAGFFGASAAVDAYLVANTIPITLFGVVAVGLGFSFLPAYCAKLQENRDAANKFANRVVNSVILFSGVMIVIGFICADFFVHVFAPGFSAQQAQQAVVLTRILLPAMLGAGVAAVYSTMLQADNIFGPTAVMGIIQNIFIMIFIGFSWRWGIVGVAMGTLLGYVGQILPLYASLHRQGYRYRLDLGWDADFTRMVKLMGPMMITSGTAQLAAVVGRMLASQLPAGSIAALNYAFKLFNLPAGLIGGPLSTALYPTMAQQVAAGQREKVGSTLSKASTLMLLTMAPITVSIIILRDPIVRLVFQRGAFTAQDTMATAIALLFVSLGLPAINQVDLLRRVFLALEDSLSLMYAGFIGFVLLVGVDLLLVGPMVHGGLALGEAASVTGICIVLSVWVRTRLRLPGSDLSSTFKVVAAGIGMSGVMYFVVRLLGSNGHFWSDVRLLTLSEGLGLVAYIALLYAVGVEDIRRVWLFLRTRGQKSFHVA